MIRCCDILLGVLGGLLALPLLPLIALAIKLDDSGPVFFTQERLGLQRRPFTLLKFRTMRTDAETTGPRWASADDPRVTAVGQLLRASHLDELPQLFNIVKGDLSFVGPRPLRRHFIDLLVAENPDYERRLQVKPGLTGWAQLYAPRGTTIEEKAATLCYDLRYCAEGLTLKTYFKLIALTALRVLRCQGT